MHLSRYLDDVVVWAPAKVNLYLEVLGKRADGYHAIESLMVTAGLFDTLVLRDAPPGTLTLTCSEPALSTGDDNLVMRAGRLLQQEGNAASGARMRLVKRIPLAAGLAGGSSDAAAALAGLNRLWQLGLANVELARLGAALGSDVPFFFHGPAAWCTGRGEVVTPVPVGASFEFVLCCPPFGLATADVYRRVVVPERTNSGAAICAALARGDAGEVGKLLFNRLWDAAVRLDSRVREDYKRLADLAPAGQLMSGSGSTLFALCRSNDEAERIATALREQSGNAASGNAASGNAASGNAASGNAASGNASGAGYRVFTVRGCV